MSSLTNQTAEASAHHSAAARVEQLYASHSGLVRSVCRSLLRDAVEAEDAVQQTFLSAQQALLNGSSPRNAAAWLVTIARHESFARVQARMREPLPMDTEGEATGPDAHAVAVHRQEFGDLRDALTELPTQQREAILLREMRGLSYEEVASTLSVTTSAVESLLFRARRNLQVRLRNALALFPPGGLARELAIRLGGGFTAPAATKALAVGLGAAVITGGLAIGPRIIDRGNARQSQPAAGPRSVQRITNDAPFNADLSSSAGLKMPMPSKAPARHESGGHSTGGIAASRPGGSDQNESPSRRGSDGSGDTNSTSDSSNSGSDGGAGTSSGDNQTTSSGDGTTSTDSSSETTDSQSTTETTTTTASDGSGG